MHISYLPTLTLPALGVDSDKKGVASDHDMIIFPPASSKYPVVKRGKKTLRIRPLPYSRIQECSEFFACQSWDGIYKSSNVHEKVEKFHIVLKSIHQTSLVSQY